MKRFARRAGGLHLVAGIVGCSATLGPGSTAPTGGPSLLYVPNQSVARVSVIDLATNEIIEIVDLEAMGFGPNARPHHVAVEPDGSFWYVSLIGANQVLKFDRDNRLVGSAPFEVPGIVAVHPTEDWLFVGRSMAAVDPPERIGRIRRFTMEIEEWDVFIPHPHALGIGTEGRVYVGSMGENTIAVVDAETGDVELSRFPGERPPVFVQLAVSPDGQTVVATGQLSGALHAFETNGATLTPLAEVPVGREPFDPSFTPDGAQVWVGALRDSYVAVVDTESWTVVDRVTAPGISQPHGSAVSRDGRFVFIGSRNENAAYTPERDFGFSLPSGTIAVIDRATRQVVRVIETPPYAAGLGIAGGTGVAAEGVGGGEGAAGTATSGGGAASGDGWTMVVRPFEVSDPSGQPYAMPFLGGFNSPRPQLVDIDADGAQDLFIQEETDRLRFFENVGTDSEARYEHRPGAFDDLSIGEWYRFSDVDGDGDSDLLAEEPFSYLRLYWNEGPGAAGLPTFGASVDTIQDSSGEPIFSDRQNIPNVADLDCDGNLDLLIGRLTGTVAHYEATGALDAGGLFRLVDDQFQGIEIIADPAAIDGPPAAQPISPALGRLPTTTFANAPIVRRHGANTLALADVDQDGDSDLFWGDFFEPGLLFIENTGSCEAANFRSEPVPFPIGDPIRTSGYNAATFGDLNGDGRPDLVMGVLGGAYDPNTTTADNLYYMPQRADGGFDLETRRFISQIDVGSESVATLVDLDADGDLDLVLSNRIEPTQVETARMYHFENVGTSSVPRFAEAGTLDVAGAYHNAPAFGDLDGDGDLDIVLGTWRRDLLRVENVGSATDPRFQVTDSAFVSLSRGSNAAPTLGDLDGDGDLDLIVGESDGTLTLFVNGGGTGDARYELAAEGYEGIDVGRRSFPVLVDWDADGDLDLAVGSEAAGVSYFENRGGPGNADFQPSPSPFPEGGALPRFVTPTFGDLDGDGTLEMISGGVGGGAHYFERQDL